MSKSLNLTICTVSFGHQKLIEINLNLSRALNKNFDDVVKWIIADNAFQNPEMRLNFNDQYLTVLSGSDDVTHGASQHHALALNSLLAHIETRYLLVLDPDFYLLGFDWIDEILSHMRNSSLSFFGTPWHPRYSANYRYFPAVHCFFVDTHKIPIASLDFRPYLDRLKTQPARKTILDALPFLFKRKRISWDTGTRIFERYHNHEKTLYECTTPVFRDDRIKCGSNFTKCVEPILPEEYCFFPKNINSYVNHGFYEDKLCHHPIPDLWEENYWNGKPFGLHMRGSYAANSRDKNQELRLLESTLSELTKIRFL